MVQVVCTGCGAVEQLHGSLLEQILWKIRFPDWMRRFGWKRMPQWLCINTQCYDCLRAADAGELPASLPRSVCRQCGCTDNSACLLEGFQMCHWVERDLCSRCA